MAGEYGDEFVPTIIWDERCGFWCCSHDWGGGGVGDIHANAVCGWGGNCCVTVSSRFSNVSTIASVGGILLLLLVGKLVDGGEIKDGAKLTEAAAAVASCSTPFLLLLLSSCTAAADVAVLGLPVLRVLMERATRADLWSSAANRALRFRLFPKKTALLVPPFLRDVLVLSTSAAGALQCRGLPVILPMMQKKRKRVTKIS